MRIIPVLLIAIFFTIFKCPLDAAYTIKDGKLIPTHEVATLSVQEHYGLLREAVQNEKWEQLILQCNIISRNFPDSPFSADAQYYLAVGYFHINELEFANKQFDKYLKNQTAPKFFEESISFKFKIAEKFRLGSKKHLLGVDALPKWVPAKEEAIEIYDEVIIALPNHELAIQSMFGKAHILFVQKEFKSSIETFQNLIRKFPKHPLSGESFIGIAQCYLSQCKNEYPDPDFLELAEINLKKFQLNFPNEPRIAVALDMLVKMKEVYAGALFHTAQFYERTKKPQASAIYYNKIVSKYPDTKVAVNSEKRLTYLESKFKKTFKDSRLFQASDDIAGSNEKLSIESLKSIDNTIDENLDSTPISKDIICEN